jgi:hypothetical protein
MSKHHTQLESLYKEISTESESNDFNIVESTEVSKGNRQITGLSFSKFLL